MGHDTKSAVNLDSLHGDVVVATLTISLSRAGMMSLSGSITDEHYIAYMLETATQYMRGYHAKQKLGERSPIIVPAHDTALTGTPHEKLLLAARHEIADAMAGK
jgi:hypothetical protein